MIRWLLRLLLGDVPLRILIRDASQIGRITFTQTAIDPGIGAATHGVMGWQCMLRAHERPDELDGNVERRPQFSWKGEGVSMEEAISDALTQAKDMGGTTARILGDQFAPRLGGRRYD